MSIEDQSLFNKDYLYMSVDYGIKKIGFAIGQLVTKKSRPIKIIYNKNGRTNWKMIDELILEWKPNVIIIGFPYSSAKSSFTQKLEIFFNDMNNKYKEHIKIIKFSEYLSTEESRVIYSNIRKSQYNISKKRSLDDISASLILQSWIDGNMIN